MNTQNGNNHEQAIPPQTQDEQSRNFRLRAEHPRVTRLSRKVLAGGSAAAFESIELDLFCRALALSNLVQPPSIEAAQYSVPYVVGLVAVHGSGVLLPMQPDCLGDDRPIAVASRVMMRVDPKFDSCFLQRLRAALL